MTIYRVNNHGPNRMSRRYSIDQVGEDGHFLCQEAFYYPTAAAAADDAQRLIAEDNARGVASRLIDGVGKLS